MLALAFDFSTIPSYLALTQTTRFAARLGVDLELIPMPRTVKPVPLKKDGENISQRHVRVRAEYEAMDQRRYAGLLGVEIARDPVAIDAQSAIDAMLVANVAGQGEAFALDMLAAYWSGTIELDAGTVTARLGAARMAMPDDHELQALRDANEARIDELGLFATPGYHANGQVFLGRQHLPMIERIIAGDASFD